MASRCSASDAGGNRRPGSAAGFESELNHLEEVILSKVQQRAPARMGEDTFIAKACKYYDLSDAGSIDFNQFKRAFAPFTTGVVDQDLRIVFDRYAVNGALFYKQFSIEFARGTRRELGAMPLGSEALAEAWENPEVMLLRMKDFLCSKGPRAIIGLASAFKEMDPDNQRSVGYDCFRAIVGDLFSVETGCPVQDATIGHIFEVFQQPYMPGCLAYDEFLQAFKEDPWRPERREAVRAAFRRLDTDSEGLANVNKMMSAFNPTRHPFVCDESRSPEEIVDEFTETFQDCLEYRRGQRAYPTNMVAWEEFEDYYKFISSCYESDGLFCSILHRVWDLDKGPNSSIEAREALARPAAGIPAKSRAGLHHWQQNTLPANLSHNNCDRPVTVDDVMDRVRGIIAKRGLRAAVDVVKNFYAADDDVDDLLDVYDFRRACQQSGITLRDPEEQVCFEACGTESTGGQRRGRAIHLQRFLRMLHGPLPRPRYELIEQAFRALGGDPDSEESTISPAVLKESFCAEAHPQAVKGARDAGVLLGEFLDTFSLLAHVRGGCQGGGVAFSDFLAYYDIVSSTIDNDALFDLLMHRLWPMDAQTLAEQRQAECASPVSPSKRERWAAPVFDARDQAVPRQRPPAHFGASSYTRPATAEVSSPDTHRRFARTAGAAAPPPEGAPHMSQSHVVAGAPAAGHSSITRSSIVFNEPATGELGAVLGRLRQSLARRGLKGWRTLGERFQQHDNRRNGGIMRGDWQRVHRGMGLGLSMEEQEVVFKNYSQGRRDGAMDYQACLRAVRGPLSERRLALVSRLFEEIRQGEEVMPPEALKARFEPKNTPLCLVGTKDVKSEREDFDGAVDHFSGGRGVDAQGFVDLFTMLSSIYPEEDEFKLMATTAFGHRGASMGGC